ncbi:MAG: NUDIX hydrolase [Treponema sp.]|jgi:8-oxo-dGTP pyrophosphatase MutT (NUDIX family)|nr:NUDIX hydrolase [Treponema sp.]
MDTSHLTWKEIEHKEVYRSRIFSVRDTKSRSPGGEVREFTIIDAPDWVIVAPLITTAAGEDAFVMVNQWRHGSGSLSMEFPGGVLEPGETPEEGALRELSEETAMKAGTIVHLGTMGPNPAIMSNHTHFFCAYDLMPLPSQKLDDDEYVDSVIINAGEVARNMGKPPYIHALTAAALALFITQAPRSMAF